jgi:hypothetical protein
MTDLSQTPAPSVLYEWLNRAFDEKLIRREGEGRRTDPYRYRLENADAFYWDRGELPPLKPLFPGWQRKVQFLSVRRRCDGYTGGRFDCHRRLADDQARR